MWSLERIVQVGRSPVNAPPPKVGLPVYAYRAGTKSANHIVDKSSTPKAQVKCPPIQERWPVKMPPPLAGHCRWHQSKHRLQCAKMTTERNTYKPTCLVTDVRQSRRSLRCYETWKAATPAVPSKTSSEWSKTVKGMVRNGAECCRKVRMMKCGSRR